MPTHQEPSICVAPVQPCRAFPGKSPDLWLAASGLQVWRLFGTDGMEHFLGCRQPEETWHLVLPAAAGPGEENRQAGRQRDTAFCNAFEFVQ